MKKLIFIIAVLCFAAGARADLLSDFQGHADVCHKALNEAKMDVNDSLAYAFNMNLKEVVHAYAYNEKTFSYLKQQLTDITNAVFRDTPAYNDKRSRKGIFDSEKKMLADVSLIFNDKDKNPVYDQYHFEQIPDTKATSGIHIKRRNAYNAAVLSCQNVFVNHVKRLNDMIEAIEAR
ncbi:MAG: hypothetical protein LBI01_00865 [Elusimicrobium sp.]|jgi:hypothetical protein|nr:hypothetical protein [Elusimicrobium sp.]